MKRTKYTFVSLFITLIALFAIVVPTHSQEVEKGWRTWIRVSPCVDHRSEWIVMGSKPPAGTFGGMWYDPAANHFQGTTCNNLHPFGCTYAAAKAEALLLQTSPKFLNYCCKDWNIWKNRQTGQFEISKTIWKIPERLEWVKGGLCCEEAQLEAGITGQCDVHMGGGCSACFASDPGAGSPNRNDHLTWGSTRSKAELEGNLKYKLDMLINCSSATDDDIVSAFASFSATLGQNFPNPACFGDDAGAASSNYGDHERWALANDRSEILADAEWKVESAFKCLKPGDEARVFADLSVAISKCARSSGPVVGPVTRSTPQKPFKEGAEELDSPDDDPVPPKKESATPDGERPCTAEEQAAFAEILGRKNRHMSGFTELEIGGSCENVRGTTEFEDFCGGGRKQPNPPSYLKVYRSTFTGRMIGKTLVIQFTSTDPRSPSGTGNCTLEDFPGWGTKLVCSGHPCG